MDWKVELQPSARAQLRLLPDAVRREIGALIDNLRTDPFPPDCIQLENFRDLYRIRMGRYRLIYRVSAKRQLALVERIRVRGEAYSGLEPKI